MTRARAPVASSIDADPAQVTFTSSGTEANQTIIRSVLEPLLQQGRKPHWITTPVEHDCTLQMARWLESRGGRVSFLPVSRDGLPDAASLNHLISADTALVSLIWVNNETGAITDIEALVREARRQGDFAVHLDAAQAWGKLPVSAKKTGADFLAFSGHKIGALAGTGLIWAANAERLKALLPGKQENSRRGGTENLMGIVALGAAAANLDPARFAGTVGPLRDRLEAEIARRIPGVHFHSALAPRVANTSGFHFDGIGRQNMVMELDLEGYSISAGSACASGAPEPSHVLLAMGIAPDQALSSVRVSLAETNTWEELEGFVQSLEKVIARLRARSGVAAAAGVWA